MHSINDGMSVQMGKKINQYMQERFINDYTVHQIEDRGCYFTAEIFGSDGKVKETTDEKIMVSNFNVCHSSLF